MTTRSDKELGMDQPIARRDFLQGAAIGVGGVLLGGLAPELIAASAELAEQDRAGYYPPKRLGMRGSHPGSFEAAHALRDSRSFTGSIAETGESFDLIVVGAGISGLAAAHFFRASSPRGRVLVLDNHDDFGGHAKRNEFHVNGRMHLLNGGTLSIESPRPYGKVAADLMRTLGVDAKALDEACTNKTLYESLGLHQGVFFDRETFGVDRLVVRKGDSREATAAYLAQTPLSENVRKDILRIEHGDEDYMPGLTSAQKKDRLARISYEHYLLKVAKADPGVLPYYLHVTDGWWGCGIDAVSALDCWGTWFPGFQGLGLEPGEAPRMGFTPAGFAATGGSDTFHYPDGNASIARLLVRSLIPTAMPGRDARDIVTAVADYTKLDRAESAARIRLNSTVLRVRNVGNDRVEVIYSRGGNLYRTTGRQCVLACWNHMVPYLCPELPEAQKTALHQLVKTPLVYVSVALRNWRAFQRLRRSASRRARRVLLELRIERSGRHRRIQKCPLARRADSCPNGTDAGEIRPARARATQGRSRGAAGHAVRNLRASDPRRARPRTGRRRLRSGPRHRRHRRQSLAARLRTGIQHPRRRRHAAGKNAERHRPTTLRTNRDREFRRRHGRLHGRCDRASASRCA